MDPRPTATQDDPPRTWRDFLSPYPELIDGPFARRWAGVAWQPEEDDRKAAARLHMQLVSRVTTQPLGYLDGVEQAALDSVYAIFKEARTICDAYPLARHFEMVAWEVLNSRVRPFTARWHRESQLGRLRGLDATDDFRAELLTLQGALGRFLDLLLHLRDGKPPPPPAPATGGETTRPADQEMEKALPWGIPEIRGGIAPAETAKLNAAEREAILARRAHYGLPAGQAHATALALSGGGIRSATFSLGVLVALARRGLLPQFDYLSTVSGGGYLGSFLTTYLNSPPDAGPAIGLRADEQPFVRDAGESDALRHIRHHSKYLATGGLGERLRMVASQLYGMALNGLGIVLFAALFALAEHFLRTNPALTDLRRQVDVLKLAEFYGILLAGWAIVSLVLIRRGPRRQEIADTGVLVLGGICAALLAWLGLGCLHRWLEIDHPALRFQEKTVMVVLGAIPVVASAFAGIAGKVFRRAKELLGLLSGFAAPLFFFGIYLILYFLAGRSPVAFEIAGFGITRFEVLTGILAVVGFVLLDINFTSPHRHYRNKLAEAYLIQPAKRPRAGKPFDDGIGLKLSQAGQAASRGPYHLVNAALNVPASKDPRMQGRLTDFFLFSPGFCGSPLTGYSPTTGWEACDPHLDVATAMAISGAAAAPQMGLGTKRRMSFWLALLNIRLGYWLRRPEKSAGFTGGAPGLWFLLKEMLGTMDERSPWLYLSDGGHIENLGLYEPLRRRCKFIVAVDGEQDERMTFAALTTVQRLASIDLGVTIDIDLDDLRLDDKGLSRSHFRFCRIRYSDDETGYLLYIKLSLTGNEGEFLRRYRLDDPAFPHDPTTDQLFSEAQFEAYRCLGEHVGNKLFLRTLVGESLATADSVTLGEWFGELGTRLLERPPQGGAAN